MEHQDVRTRVKLLTPEELIDKLQNRGGHLCYDHESTSYLRDLWSKDIDTGVLPATVLQTEQ